IPAPGPSEVPLDTPTSDPRIPYEPQQPSPAPAPGRKYRTSGGGTTTASRAVAELQAELAELAAAEPGARVEITWRVVGG
ncbi:hypothetical protein EF903_03365, partial [Streptomyces sp. WAC05292]|uniref:hypothetical protein n=1 Tax=Streptomyces sp. WAC05292 TaxID=2487418 RepID=UPI000F948B62